MDKLNTILQELGISKVKLAKYLGVSRQMVYNYLLLDSLDKWPKEKKLLILQLLNIQNGSDETLSAIDVSAEYVAEVEKRLNTVVKTNGELENFLDFNSLSKDKKTLLSDLTYLIKEKLEEENKESYDAMKYLYYLLQSIDNVPEIKYILGYMAKINCFVNPEEFAFNEDKQYIFEGILYSALTLYNNGKASKSKITETRRRLIQEIEQKKEEKLERTAQLNTIKVQALRELGYEKITTENSVEVFEKMAEIESRNV